MKPAPTYEEFKAIIWDQVLKEGVEGGWEDDPIQEKDPDYRGGANKMSLNEARAAYAKGLPVF